MRNRFIQIGWILGLGHFVSNGIFGPYTAEEARKVFAKLEQMNRINGPRYGSIEILTATRQIGKVWNKLYVQSKEKKVSKERHKPLPISPFLGFSTRGR